MTRSRTERKTRLLAISSGGGHWVQLLRLRPAFEGCEVIFSSVLPAYAQDVKGERFIAIRDATRWDLVVFVLMVLRVVWVVLRVRPDIIISTGAAPGYVAIRVGRAIGARTAWVDSIANVEEMSYSGRKAAACADLWLTQWEHLARPRGGDEGRRTPHFRGSVI